MRDNRNKKHQSRGHKPQQSRGTAPVAEGRMVIGRNSVEAILTRDPSRISELLVSSEERGRAQRLLASAEQAGIQVTFLQKGELTKRAGSESHQGFVALVKGELLGTRQMLIDSYRDSSRFLIVALDGVQDPHNVGAIIRAAECFAIDGVVWSKNRSSGVTPAVTKVAVGGTELVPLYEVANLADTILALEKDCGAAVVCADGGEGALALDKLPQNERVVLVLGAEGDGVSDLIKRRAHFRAQIPMLGQIDSLNVSQAAAVFFYELRKRISIASATDV